MSICGFFKSKDEKAKEKILRTAKEFKALLGNFGMNEIEKYSYETLKILRKYKNSGKNIKEISYYCDYILDNVPMLEKEKIEERFSSLMRKLYQ